MAMLVFAGQRKMVQAKKLKNSGFVTIFDKENKVISNPFGSLLNTSEGKIKPMYQTTKTFMHVHDVCVDDEENIYKMQWLCQRDFPI